MTGPAWEPSLSENEKDAINMLSRHWEETLDFKLISKYKKKYETEGPPNISPLERTQLEPNKRAAAMIATSAEDADPSTYLWRSYTNWKFAEIETGLKAIETLDTYWLYEPTIERLFELDTPHSEVTFQLIRDFEKSDYSDAMVQPKDRFRDTIDNITHDDLISEPIDSETINQGIYLLDDAMGIFERGFPLLLGVKRILDGDDPSLSTLQETRAPHVRRELTHTDKHPNSVYFDLIVKQFETPIRNGLAHGDIMHDQSNKQIKIPNRDIKYSYEEFGRITRTNVSNAIFLSGTFQALIHLQFVIEMSDDLSRNQFPV